MKIKHIVLLKFDRGTSDTKIKDLMRQLADLQLHLPGFETFSWGKYSSQEGLNQGFTHGFEILFSDAKYRDNYLIHPKHQDIANLINQCLEKTKEYLPTVIAFDYDYTQKGI